MSANKSESSDEVTQPAAKLNTITINGKARYYEPAATGIDVASFRKVVMSRRSVRKFTDTPIPQTVLDECLDLALLAPNSSNLQPWTFYVVRSEHKKAQLVTACMNQLAAKTAAELIVCVARTDRIDQFAKKTLQEWPMPNTPKAATTYYQLIPYNFKVGLFNSVGRIKKAAFALARQFNPLPLTPYSDTEVKMWAAKSTALACENLVLALRAYGFDSCMMEGIDEPRIAKLLKLNSKCFPIMVIAAGERAVDGVFWPQVRFERELFVQEV